MRAMLVQAALNGARVPADHARLPLDAAALAADSAGAVSAGAAAVHIHPRDDSGRESLSAAAIGSALGAIRARCPGLPTGVSTAAWIQPDVERRLVAIAGWSVIPDFASVNLSEPGALRVIELLNERGIGVEAGISSEADARLFVEWGLDSACLRVLVEVESGVEPAAAVRAAAAIDLVLDDGLVETPRLHHGSDAATWSVIAAAIDNGHDVRIGLEDTLTGRDGGVVSGNAALIDAVVAMARDAGRHVDRIATL